MKGRKQQLVNIPGITRYKECDIPGAYEVIREIDVLAIIPERKRKFRILPVVGSAGIIGGAILGLLYLAPAFTTIIFAVLAVCLFGALTVEK